MGCCLAAALMISLGRRAWFAIAPGRAPQDLAFAPPARRPAPAPATPRTPRSTPRVAQIRGLETASGPDLRHSAADLRHSATPPRRIAAPMAAVLAVLAYVTTVALLRAAGLLTQHHPATVTWLTRDLAWAAALTALLLVALRTRPRTRVDEGARAVAAAGATWTALAVVDMHVFGLVGFGSSVGDVLFHGAGLGALFVGLALRRPPSLPAQSRRTEGVTS